MSKVHYKQGDIIYLDFSPAVDTEMEGIHPAVIISNDRYNRNTNYLMVVPITSGGTCFNGYVKLNDYKYIYMVELMQHRFIVTLKRELGRYQWKDCD